MSKLLSHGTLIFGVFFGSDMSMHDGANTSALVREKTAQEAIAKVHSMVLDINESIKSTVVMIVE